MTQTLSATRATLLGRLRDIGNADAWAEFVENYTPRIYGWCRRYNLQESDAADVTQEVLAKLVRSMQTFEYNPSRGSFRGWLKTVTNNTIRDLIGTFSRPGRGTGDSHIQRNLAAVQDPEALASLAKVLEEEGERELLAEAEERVQLRVQQHTWQAYVLTVKHGTPAPDAARELGISVADIYVAKSRVIKRLKQEVERLNESPLDEE